VDRPDEHSHGCEVEVNTTEYVVHAVHIPPENGIPYGFQHLAYDIVRRALIKKDSLIPVDGHERGSGKSRLTQHFIRTELWPLLFEYELVATEDWDWRHWTVFYDSDEYQAKFLSEHVGWAVETDDEAWTKMMSRNSMRGTQKETMECFGVGRFLKVIGFIMTPGYLEVDKIVRNTVATHWLHIMESSEHGATVCVLEKCHYQHWPMGKAFWDCLAHIEYPYTFPKDLDDEFEAEKMIAWQRYLSDHEDFKARRIERMKRHEDLLAKKLEAQEAEFVARRRRGSKKEKDVEKEKETMSSREEGIAALEGSETVPPTFPE